MKKVLVCVATFGAVFAAPSGVASADSAGYMAELQANGVPIMGLEGPGRYINAGYTICTMLRNGESPAVAADSSGFGMLYIWKTQLVTAAQNNLCPDTRQPTPKAPEPPAGS